MKKPLFIKYDGIINFTPIDGEIWKDVVDGYEVSNLGRVRSKYREFINSIGRIARFNAYLLSPVLNNGGYFKVSISTTEKGKRKQKLMSVHRLVCFAFIENPHLYDQINHIDGNKQNNNYSNLEWCNNLLNRQHAFRTGLQSVLKGEASANSKLTNEIILQIREMAKTKKQVDIAKIFGLRTAHVSEIVIRTTWKHI